MTRWALQNAVLYAGFRPLAGKAPFARGPVILARDGSFLKVEDYPDAAHADGVVLTAEDVEGHLQAREATRLTFPIPAFAEAGWWVLRAGSLRGRPEIGTVARHTQWGPDGACGVVVDEKAGRRLRLQWAAQEREAALACCRSQEFPAAEQHSILAFCLDVPAPTPETLALCLLTHWRANHPEEAEALQASIQKTSRRTPDLAFRVQEYVSRYEAALTPVRPTPSYRQQSAIRASLSQLRSAA